HLIEGFIAEGSNGGQVVVIDPDEPRFARAAVAALRAGEAQPLPIPRLLHARVCLFVAASLRLAIFSPFMLGKLLPRRNKPRPPAGAPPRQDGCRPAALP